MFILDNYDSICSGIFDTEYSQEEVNKTKRNIFRAPFENSIVSKADIDIAIDKLGRPGRWCTWCKCIETSPENCGLTPKQYKLAEYIRGSNNHITSIVRELSEIA